MYPLKNLGNSKKYYQLEFCLLCNSGWINYMRNEKVRGECVKIILCVVITINFHEIDIKITS